MKKKYYKVVSQDLASTPVKPSIGRAQAITNEIIKYWKVFNKARKQHKQVSSTFVKEFSCTLLDWPKGTVWAKKVKLTKQLAF